MPWPCRSPKKDSLQPLNLTIPDMRHNAGHQTVWMKWGVKPAGPISLGEYPPALPRPPPADDAVDHRPCFTQPEHHVPDPHLFHCRRDYAYPIPMNQRRVHAGPTDGHLSEFLLDGEISEEGP